MLKKLQGNYLALGGVFALASILLRVGGGDMLGSTVLMSIGRFLIASIPVCVGVFVIYHICEDNLLWYLLYYAIVSSIVAVFLLDATVPMSILVFIAIAYSAKFLKIFKTYGEKYYKLTYISIGAMIIGIIVGSFVVQLYSIIGASVSSIGSYIAGSPKGFQVFLYGFLHTFLKPLALQGYLDTAVLFGEETLYETYVIQQGSGNIFMSGLYPVTLLGYMGIVISLFLPANKEKWLVPQNKEYMVGLLGMVSATVITGVTGIMDYFLMLLAPLLYFLHSVLTGVSYLLSYLAEVSVGYIYGSGIIDLIQTWNRGMNSHRIILLGCLIFLLYFWGSFRICYCKTNCFEQIKCLIKKFSTKEQ